MKLPLDVLCALVLVPPVAAGVGRAADEPLEISVVVSPTETLPGLPIAVTIQLKNTSEEEQTYGRGALENVIVWIESSEGGVRSYRSRGIIGCGQTGLSRLRPGELSARKVWLFRDDKATLAIPEPGRYVVRGSVDLMSGSGQAGQPAKRLLPEVEVEVRPVEGAALEAVRAFSEATSWMGGDPLTWELVPTEESLARLKDVSARYGDSIYAQYARFVLAAYYGSPKKESASIRKKEEERVSDLRRAVDTLEHLDRKLAPENLRTEVRLALARDYFKLGEADKARMWLDRVEQPDRLPEPLLRDYHALSARIRR